MLSSVLGPVGNISVGQHPSIFIGVFNERPPVRELVPEWDLLLILVCLKESPFEPLKDAQLKFLTGKTCLCWTLQLLEGVVIYSINNRAEEWLMCRVRELFSYELAHH